MTGIGLALLAIGLGDLASGGLSGQPANRGLAAAGVGVAFAVAAGGAWLTRLGGGFYLVVLATAGTAGWLFSRCSLGAGALGARRALGILSASLAAPLVFGGRWEATFPGWLHSWLSDFPLRIVAQAGLDRLFLGVGILVALTGTANGVVRAVLAVAGSEIARSEERLRGGRFIGAIERVLIFGLAVGGEPTAAALIASAKSILRFPELSRVARDGAGPEPVPAGDQAGKLTADVDVVTEYFLLGSLVSWLTALIAVALFVG